ncbi:hypothetical protein LOTGIDRAFT_228149 [Lottia gigantea]|uniref:Golgi membrane protein 1 n=1 Tax=Lottia gigantea TaxID=225164 RepID=V4ANC2_LOTGI|nr:hypothetical protein LOTGIDRAFT_228149 [Lottia gigantea]ESP05669.1 hypothetical protein LOTGIDRAFT_228149 [Lottia gigantea]
MTSSNGRGALRPSGRSPPFLLIGLSVALCIIGFNYWSVSSRNSELLTQITILKREVTNQATMKITAEKRLEEVGSRASKYLDEKNKCMTDRRSIQENADDCVESSKACEADRSGLNERLQQVESGLQEEIMKNTQSEKKCDLKQVIFFILHLKVPFAYAKTDKKNYKAFICPILTFLSAAPTISVIKHSYDVNLQDQFPLETVDKSHLNFISEHRIGFQPAHQILNPRQEAVKDYDYDMQDDEPGQKSKEQKDKPNVVIEESSIDKLKKQLEEQEH